MDKTLSIHVLLQATDMAYAFADQIMPKIWLWLSTYRRYTCVSHLFAMANTVAFVGLCCAYVRQFQSLSSFKLLPDDLSHRNFILLSQDNEQHDILPHHTFAPMAYLCYAVCLTGTWFKMDVISRKQVMKGESVPAHVTD